MEAADAIEKLEIELQAMRCAANSLKAHLEQAKKKNDEYLRRGAAQEEERRKELGLKHRTDRLCELANADKEGRCIVLPVGGYTEADGEEALRQAMCRCNLTNNCVNRYIADAIAEKLVREETASALKKGGVGWL